MSSLALTLIPFVVGSALVPVLLGITVLLLRSPAGRSVAIAWILGMAAVRLLQGLVFGLLLGSSDEVAPGSTGSSIFESAVLIVLALMFYGVAIRKVLHEPDEDAPPSRWLSALDGLTPIRAFLLGAALLLVGMKSWVFTLGAIGAIRESPLNQAEGTVVFLVFVALAMSIHLALVATAWLAPERADVLLGRIADGLTRYDRPLMIGLGAIFGTWFLWQGLAGLGIP